MTDPGALSSWNPKDDLFSLNDEAPKPRPRAWERAPKSPVLARHHGRKVWKRYEAPVKPETKEGSRDAEQGRQALGDATNTPRPVKRLRLKDAPKAENDGKENKAAQYFTTLRDEETAGTPRRKQASRKSLKPDKSGVEIRSTTENTLRLVDESENVVQDNLQCVQESSALEDVRELLGSGDDLTGPEGVAATSPTGRSDEITDDKFIETEGATSSKINAITDRATSADEIASETEAMTSSKVFNIVEEAIKTDNDITINKAVSGNAAYVLMDPAAHFAENVIVPSQSRHGKTVIVEGAISVESASTSSPNVFHSASVSETLPIDVEGIPRSPLKKSPKASAEEGLILEQPILDSSLMLNANSKTPKRESPRKKPRLPSPNTVTTPCATRTPKLTISANPVRADYPCETPQIGTSLLRRESLRRRESPSKKKDARKDKTTEKRDTLQRRDTLQEREILQKVIAETRADHSDAILDTLPIETSTLRSSNSAPRAENEMEDNAHGNPEPVLCEQQVNLDTVEKAEAVLPAVDKTNVEKDLHRAMEAIEVYEHPDITDTNQSRLDNLVEDSQGIKAMDKANEVLAKTELDDVSEATEFTREQTPNQKTRSRARFSDETSMLKDFLNRAQAKKAAQKPLLSAPEAPIPQQSPRRSPRKTHGSQDGQASLPQKPRNIANRPNTPPGKPMTEAFDSDDGEEQTVEPASCRRSTRTRLAAPSKAAPGAPSFIPVRRADGTDAVVLQKSQAQELAVTTRANTRRNKGQSKPPLLALQDLATERVDLESTAKQRAEKAKTVAWAERLASYRDAKDEADESEERRPIVRRLRGLGAMNGTQAAKRTTAVVKTSNGTPAPKRRGKV